MVLHGKPILICSALLTLMNIFAVLVLSWAAFRGFEISDESYYYLGYLYADNSTDLGPASFHLIFDKLFGALQLTLPETRLLRLLLTVFGSVIFHTGVCALAPRRNLIEKAIFFNLILSGMLLSYTWGPLALSYNSMSSIIISIIVGIWLFNMVTNNSYLRACYSVILGGMFVLLFFVKITNILLLPLLSVTTLIWHIKIKSNAHLRIKYFSINVIALTVGAIGTLAFISNGIVLIPEKIDRYLVESLSMIDDDPTHSTTYLWNRYYDNAKMIFHKLKRSILLIFVFFILVKAYDIRNQRKASVLVSGFFKITGLIILATIVYMNELWKGGTGYVYIILIPYIFIIAFAYSNKLLEGNMRSSLLPLCMIIIPLIGAVGTNNGLSGQVLFYGVFIVCIIYYFLESCRTNWFRLTIIVLVVALGTCQITLGATYYPYRQAQLMKSNNILNDVDKLQHLRVTENILNLREQLIFLEQVEAEYMFTTSYQGGMIILANKKPYSLQWFTESLVLKTCLIIDKSKIEPNNIIFLIPSEKHLAEKIIKCLENRDIFINDDFVKVRQISFLDSRLKKPAKADIFVPFKGSTDF